MAYKSPAEALIPEAKNPSKEPSLKGGQTNGLDGLPKGDSSVPLVTTLPDSIGQGSAPTVGPSDGIGAPLRSK